MLGGLIGAVVVTALMYLGLFAGILRYNILHVIASVSSFGEIVPSNSANYAYGIAFFTLFVVVAVPLCYAYWGYSYLPGAPWMRGLIAGLFLWFLMEMFMMPLAGQGVFAIRGEYPVLEIVTQFVLWAIYGVLLGFIAGPQEVWQQRPHQERPA